MGKFFIYNSHRCRYKSPETTVSRTPARLSPPQLSVEIGECTSHKNHIKNL